MDSYLGKRIICKPEIYIYVVARVRKFTSFSCRIPRSSNLTVSVVITFYQEWPSILLRTIYSVVIRTENLKEIILVDDGNNGKIYKHFKQSFGGHSVCLCEI